MAATELHGARQDGGGVKIKFIETQFVSSDAASFKSVVQRLTGKSAQMPLPGAPHRPRPRPCGAASAAGAEDDDRGTGCEDQQGPVVFGSNHAAIRPEAAFAPRRLEEVHELCDFADLLYATAGARRDGGTINGFPD